MPVFRDQMHFEVLLDKLPQRIISLVPSQTELLFDLGLENEIVGLTKFCVHPLEKTKPKTKIGGTKNFKFDVIDSLKPDLIIGNKEENYAEGIHKLKEKYPVWMSDIYTLEDALEMILSLGKLTGKEKESLEIIHTIRSNFNSFSPHFGNQPPRAAYFIWRKPWICVGGNTFIQEMLKKCGFINVFEKLPRYPKIDESQLKAANPDVILLSSEPYPFKETHIAEIQKICPQSKVIFVDGEIFSWYGSRLKYATTYFNQLLNQIQDNTSSLEKIYESAEYQLIKKIYGEKKAQRSQVLLINHIHEGLYILGEIQADDLAKKAYCLHPIFQADANLLQNFDIIDYTNLDKKAILLSVEYRNIANQYLSFREILNTEEIKLSPLKAVNDMLIADKIQNRKDFELYHKGNHPRTKELKIYFKNWLNKLGISEKSYHDYKKQLILLEKATYSL